MNATETIRNAAQEAAEETTAKPWTLRDIPPELKEMWSQAAKLSGLTKNQFAIGAISAASRRVIADVKRKSASASEARER